MEQSQEFCITTTLCFKTRCASDLTFIFPEHFCFNSSPIFHNKSRKRDFACLRPYVESARLSLIQKL